jgi:hypothetical protein
MRSAKRRRACRNRKKHEQLEGCHQIFLITTTLSMQILSNHAPILDPKVTNMFFHLLQQKQISDAKGIIFQGRQQATENYEVRAEYVQP